MKSFDLISVIIPIYNVEKYLEKCVNSVLNQTYTNLEIILVDDGSPDNCPAICDKFKIIDKRITVIHKKNGGLSDARNCGLKYAKGEYVCFIDSDDYIESTMLEELHKILIENSADVSICSINNIYEDSNRTNDSLLVEDGKVSNYESLCRINSNIVFVVAWNKLYKRSLFNNIKYREGMIHEDEFIIHHLYDKCKIIATSSKPLYNYLRRKTSITGDSSFQYKKMGYYEALIDRIEYFKKNGFEKCEYETKLKLLICCFGFIKKYSFGNVENNNDWLRARRILKIYIKSNLLQVLLSSKVSLLKKIKLLITITPGYEYSRRLAIKFIKCLNSGK